jgi:hypothetical protein
MKNNLIYVLFIIVIISLTLYFLKILDIKAIDKYKLPKLPEGYAIHYPLQKVDENCQPCEKIGEEVPRCPQAFINNTGDPILIEELKPNYSQLYDGAQICVFPTNVKINSFGFRDYEYSLDKSNNTFRIISLGDSNTFGHGVELNQSYSKVLETMLNQGNDNWKYEVFNFGVPGYNVVQKIETLKRKGLRFNPDLILVQYEGGDIMDATRIKEIREEVRSDYLKSHKISDLNESYNLLKLEMNAVKKYMDELNKKPFSEVWKIVEEPLMDLANITNRANISVIIFAYPSSNEDLYLEKIASRYGWSFVDMRELYKKYKIDDLLLNKNDPHPNVFAHNLIAEKIYEKLISDKLLPT